MMMMSKLVSAMRVPNASSNHMAPASRRHRPRGSESFNRSRRKALGEKAQHAFRSVFCRFGVRCLLLPFRTGIIETMGRAGVKPDRDLAAQFAAALDQLGASVGRDFIVGRAVEDPHRRIGHIAAF